MAAKGKILVVDDDRLVLATVTHGLSQAGYEVIDADNGDDVLKQAAARYLDRVFGVKGINAQTEVIHSIGSKAALSILPRGSWRSRPISMAS